MCLSTVYLSHFLAVCCSHAIDNTLKCVISLTVCVWFLLLLSHCHLSALACPRVSVALCLAAWQCGTCQSQWRTWGLTPFLSLLVWPQTSTSAVLSWSWWKRRVGYFWPLGKRFNKAEVYSVSIIKYTLHKHIFQRPLLMWLYSYVQTFLEFSLTTSSANVC